MVVSCLHQVVREQEEKIRDTLSQMGVEEDPIYSGRMLKASSQDDAYPGWVLAAVQVDYKTGKPQVVVDQN